MATPSLHKTELHQFEDDDDYIPHHSKKWTPQYREEIQKYTHNECMKKLYEYNGNGENTNGSVESVADNIETNANVFIETLRGSSTIGVVQSHESKKQLSRIHKIWTNLEGLAGKPYGAEFEIDQKGNIVQVDAEMDDSVLPQVQQTIIDDTLASVPLPTRDNRELTDVNASQRLTREEVLALKKNSADLMLLVKTLTENSVTFANKSEYSQQKYVRKKTTKHSKRFRVSRLTLDKLSQMYFDKHANKINELRVDGLALMLHSAAVFPGRNVLVLDTFAGLLTAAAAQKVGSCGNVVNIYDGVYPKTECLHRLGINRKAPLHVPLTAVAALVSGQAIDSKFEKAASLLRGRCIDSLIVSSCYAPIDIFRQFLPFLRSGGQFCFHCNAIEPLAQIAQHIKRDAAKSTSSAMQNLFNHEYGSNVLCPQGITDIGNFDIIDCWFRDHQVLPNRTHPAVNMTSGTGYLLFGVKFTEPLTVSSDDV